MKNWVVDASVVAAAFFEEEHARSARELLASAAELLVPDLIYAEFGNVVWKRFRRGELTADEATEMFADFLTLQLQGTPASELVEIALKIAMETQRTVYDCTYVALAIRQKSRMVTADKKLVDGLAGGAMERYLVWIGEVAAVD
jgi:predicted nucleic acid-binding protein